MLPDKTIVVFDGLCNFCSGTVRFIMKHDRTGSVFFVPLQTGFARKLAADHGIDSGDADTFLLFKGKTAFVRSDAALEMAKDLGFWKWLRVFRVVPLSWRDEVYAVLAKKRYRWFGKRDTCYVPTREEKARFIDG